VAAIKLTLDELVFLCYNYYIIKNKKKGCVHVIIKLGRVTLVFDDKFLFRAANNQLFWGFRIPSLVFICHKHKGKGGFFGWSR
jgi:hypothetical protein